MYKLGGFKKALLQNPENMIRGRIFSEMIHIRVRKSELWPESRSYRPKARVTTGQTPRIRTESPKKGTRIRFKCFYRKSPFKPSWIQLMYKCLVGRICGSLRGRLVYLPRSIIRNVGAKFGVKFRGSFGNFVSEFAFFGIFIQQKGDVNRFGVWVKVITYIRKCPAFFCV